MSDDCISRQAVLDEMMLIPIAPLIVGDEVVYKKGILEGTIKALPSVAPKPIITNVDMKSATSVMNG